MAATAMTAEHPAAFRASLKRCLDASPFLTDFYDTFMAASDEIREKFRHTNFDRQKRILTDSLYLMAVAAEGGPDNLAWRELKTIAKRHEVLGIGGTMYDVWLDCLLRTAAAHDPQFSSDLESAWRETLAPGIAHMRAVQQAERDSRTSQ
jgi:hemoglobin-like flavoprotein